MAINPHTFPVAFDSAEAYDDWFARHVHMVTHLAGQGDHYAGLVLVSFNTIHDNLLGGVYIDQFHDAVDALVDTYPQLFGASS